LPYLPEDQDGGLGLGVLQQQLGHQLSSTGFATGQQGGGRAGASCTLVCASGCGGEWGWRTCGRLLLMCVGVCACIQAGGAGGMCALLF